MACDARGNGICPPRSLADYLTNPARHLLSKPRFASSRFVTDSRPQLMDILRANAKMGDGRDQGVDVSLSDVHRGLLGEIRASLRHVANVPFDDRIEDLLDLIFWDLILFCHSFSRFRVSTFQLQSEVYNLIANAVQCASQGGGRNNLVGFEEMHASENRA